MRKGAWPNSSSSVDEELILRLDNLTRQLIDEQRRRQTATLATTDDDDADANIRPASSWSSATAHIPKVGDFFLELERTDASHSRRATTGAHPYGL